MIKWKFMWKRPPCDSVCGGVYTMARRRDGKASHGTETRS